MALNFNKYQSTLEELNFELYPQEVQDEFMDAISSIPFIKRLISPSRKKAIDCERDEEGKIIVDLTNPPIIENTDYFRPTALHFKKYGTLTDLRPNPNPNSEFGKWIREEVRRIYHGYVRKSDGAWVTGDMYFYLNYCPIIQSKIRKGTKIADRVVDFPEFWEGIFWRFHYIEQARLKGHHCAEIAKRGASKSYTVASILAKLFVVGENEENNKQVRALVTAYQKEYLVKDGTLNKFSEMIDFSAQNTQFPYKRLKSSLQDMSWKMGYTDLDTGAQRGTLNEVIGVSSKDDPDKVRGKRSSKIIIEEYGNFPKITDTYRVMLPSVQEGDIVFGQIIMIGTGGSEGADFEGAKEIIYNPKGFNVYALENVFDKTAKGRSSCIFFFGAYVNRKGCYNKDGVSDVTKALLEICYNRYIVKYNTSDPMALTRTKAENPITLQDAIMRRDGSIFPVTALKDRIMQIESDPHFYDDTFVGDLVMDKNGKVNFKSSTDIPIRFFPHKDNDIAGATEIFNMPETGPDGKVYSGRYICGVDPYDDDVSETLSLGSIFVMDLWTDNIVAEYTGRTQFAEDFYEKCRLLALFYNARINYEAHPYEQTVYTPDGVKAWGDIKVGDKLFSPTKGIVTVKDIPVDEEMDIYKITLVDGRVVYASDNHLWSVFNGTKKENELVATKDIISRGVKNKFNQHLFFIPEHSGVEYNKKDLPIDPYVMGLILAEGSITGSHCSENNIQISSSEEDMLFYKTKSPYEIKKIGIKGYSWHVKISGCKKIMMEYHLYGTSSHTKFIPKEYLFGDREQRLELLRGLMDGDGCAVKSGASIFITCSQDLAFDVLSLCRSLGFKAWLQTSRRGVYRVAIAAQESIFLLPRKVRDQHVYTPYARGSKASAILQKTAIERVEYSHRGMGKCVTVDSDDGLYLIGDYVITHNCNKKGLFMYFAKMSSLYLLADTLETLKDKELVKGTFIGNKSKGVNATLPVNNYARTLIRDWILLPVTIQEGEEETTVSKLMTIKNLALLKELSEWNIDGNFDRVSSLGMLMLFREDRLALYRGEVRQNKENVSTMWDSDFFKMFD